MVTHIGVTTRQRVTNIFVRSGCALLALLSFLAGVGRAAPIEIRPAGAGYPIYRWNTDRCGGPFIPDAPARAFRRADGKISLIATHKENWALVGSDFSALKPVCRSILSSSAMPKGGGELWIEATYTRDGQSISALVSEDLTRAMKAQGCDP